MSIARPFRRTCRPFLDGSHSRSQYISHPKFAHSPQQYVRAFLLLQKDLIEVFDYIEPADKNLDCYSYRLHELHSRICMEVESNAKAILVENRYTSSALLNMTDYRKLDATHRLSSYRVKLPIWHGNESERVPFSNWANGGALSWYRAYNAAKHDRLTEFEQANFRNVLDSICGLVAILGAQFYRHDFSPYTYYTGPSADGGWDVGIGDYFLVRFPKDWVQAECYDFDWQKIEADPDPFQDLSF